MDLAVGYIAIAAGLAVGLTGLGTGWAEKDIGSAAVGAIAENEKLFGKGITLMVLPETIVSFAIAFLLFTKIP